MFDYVVTIRNIVNGRFDKKPAATNFLKIPNTETVPLPTHSVKPKSRWIDDVLTEAETGTVGTGTAARPKGDIIFFVHGYNVDAVALLAAHKKLRDLLVRNGFQGAFVSFDWPSDGETFQYLSDRFDAQDTATQLVKDCIEPFVQRQRPDCLINLHVLAHSMGGFVVREAFDTAKYKSSIDEKNWTVSQMMFVDADVSAASFEQGNPQTLEMMKHAVRFTNYSNPYDSILKISNAKRAGLASRVGRVGLPENVAPNAINVDCGDHYEAIKPTLPGGGILELESHSWFYNDDRFAKDVLFTVSGDIDRYKIPTRRLVNGKLAMIP